MTVAPAARVIAELRAGFERTLCVRDELAAHWETIAAQSVMNAREITIQLNRSFEANVRALFDAAESQAHARSPSEFVELHRQLMSTLSERLAEQMKDFEAILLAQALAFADELEKSRG